MIRVSADETQVVTRVDRPGGKESRSRCDRQDPGALTWTERVNLLGVEQTNMCTLRLKGANNAIFSKVVMDTPGTVFCTAAGNLHRVHP